jgi:hypothetical protein
MSVVYSLITLEDHLILKDRSTNYKKLNTPLINPNRRNASKIKYKLVLCKQSIMSSKSLPLVILILHVKSLCVDLIMSSNNLPIVIQIL